MLVSVVCINPKLDKIKNISTKATKKFIKTLGIVTVSSFINTDIAHAGMIGDVLTTFPYNVTLGILGLGLVSGIGSPVCKALNKPNIAAILDQAASIIATGVVIGAIGWLLSEIADVLIKLSQI